MMKEQICCVADNSMPPEFYASSHGDVVIDAQRDTETIKAGAEIGSARRNANGNVLHRSASCWVRNDALRCGSVATPRLTGNRSVAQCRFISTSLKVPATDENRI